MDLFSWSLPFLADKLGEMMENIMNRSKMVPKDKLKLAKQSSDVDFKLIMLQLQNEKLEQDYEKTKKIKAKIMSIARLNRMLKNAKENSEILANAKKCSSDGKLP